MLMEVQTRSLSTPLDHTRPFSFSAGKCPPSSGLPSSEIHEASASDDSPVNADSDCDGFKVPFTSDGDGDGDGDSSNGVAKSTQMINDPGEMGVHEDSARRCSAVKLQKSYRGYRTRRRLADSAVVAEELWWLAIDYARLNHSTISFFNFLKPETAASRWNRISLNASKVGKGLSINGKAQKLAFQHWIEAIDPRHRYGHSLHLYYEEWCKADAGQPFFYWLDIGDGKDVDLKECPRSKLKQQTIKYLGPQEREHYEYVVVDGKIIHKQTGTFLDTKKGTKWIFVMSTFKRLYAGEKKKGAFHHSSFLAGGATLAAGRLEVEDGVLKAISAYSGHYKPTDDHLDSFLKFLEENGVVLKDVEVHRASEDSDVYDDIKSVGGRTKADTPPSKLEPLDIKKIVEEVGEDEASSKSAEVSGAGSKTEYKRTLSGGLKSPRTDVPKKAILQRINSKKTVNSYQLGHQLSLRWTTGAGPRIGCVADYPVELRVQALELVNLSPRTPPTPSSSSKRMAGFLSPTTDTFNGDDSSSSNSKS